ncbi:hypothetical protein HDU96_007962 [Phlyctochytrium bullatum]|nr:hypothetical protein HDU96_007962 [Phlyctochytrium bullatum]
MVSSRNIASALIIAVCASAMVTSASPLPPALNEETTNNTKLIHQGTLHARADWLSDKFLDSPVITTKLARDALRQISKGDESRYIQLEGFKFCTHLEGSTFDAFAKIERWNGNPVTKMESGAEGLVKLIDEEAKRISMALTERHNTRLIQTVDPIYYFQSVIPSIVPEKSDIYGPRRKYKLGVLIMVHGAVSVLENVKHLVDKFDDGSTIFLIHVDGKYEELHTAIQKYIEERETKINASRRGSSPAFGNVFLSKKRYRGRWAHVSLVYTQLSGFWELLNLADCELFINLSAVNVPLRKGREIARILQKPKYANHSFIGHWVHSEHLAGRLMRPHIPRYDADSLHAVQEAGLHAPPFPSWKVCKQHQWMILSADAVKFLRTSLLLNSPGHSTRVINTSKHYINFPSGSYHPKELDMSDVSHIGDGSNPMEDEDPRFLFTRKVDINHDKGRELLKWLDEHHLNNHVKEDSVYKDIVFGGKDYHHNTRQDETPETSIRLPQAAGHASHRAATPHNLPVLDGSTDSEPRVLSAQAARLLVLINTPGNASDAPLPLNISLPASVRPEAYPKSPKTLSRYFRVREFGFCAHLNNATFDSLVHVHPWNKTIAETGISPREFADFIDAVAKKIMLHYFKSYGFLEIPSLHRFACYCAADGANSVAFLTDQRMLTSVDPRRYFHEFLPAHSQRPSRLPGPRRQYQLGILLMAHGGADMLPSIKAQIDELDDGASLILIHVDQQSDMLYRALAEYIRDRDAAMNVAWGREPGSEVPGNVHLARMRYHAAWAHVSLVWIQLNGFWEILNLADVKHLINLSANHYPLRRGREIGRVLAQDAFRGRSFVSYWGDYWHIAGRTARPHIRRNESFNKHLTVFHPEETELMFPPYPHAKACKQHQWMILSRSAVEFLRNSSEVLMQLAYSEFTFIPDESFFCSVLLTFYPDRNLILNDNKQLIIFPRASPHPRFLDESDSRFIGGGEGIKEHENPTYFFVRKVSVTHENGRQLVDWIQRKHIMPHVLPDEEYGHLGGREFVIRPEEVGIGVKRAGDGRRD